MGKERFIKTLRQHVKEHGQQTFYAIRGTDDAVVNLLDNTHRFTVKQTIAEYKRRCEPGDVGLFDSYEHYEMSLSRMVVEALLTTEFRDKIDTRFGHHDDYDELPGSVYFMMALDTCNASTSHDIAGAKKKLEELVLTSYPGEDISLFAHEAQRLVNIMNSDYALPVNTGSQILGKVSKTSNHFFNMKMFALREKASDFEYEFKLVDPATMAKDTRYSTLGPIGLLGKIQEEYGRLLSDNDWPALATKLPEVNYSSDGAKKIDSKTTDKPESNTSLGQGMDQRVCFKCGSPDHLANKCPQKATTGNSTPSHGGGQQRSKKARWKLVKPADPLTTITDEKGRVWKHCALCIDHESGTQGYYNLSHFTSEHKADYKRPAPAACLSQSDPDPIPDGPPTVTTTEDTLDSAHDDPDELEFAWSCLACVVIEDPIPMGSPPATVDFIASDPIILSASSVEPPLLDGLSHPSLLMASPVFPESPTVLTGPTITGEQPVLPTVLTGHPAVLTASASASPSVVSIAASVSSDSCSPPASSISQQSTTSSPSSSPLTSGMGPSSTVMSDCSFADSDELICTWGGFYATVASIPQSHLPDRTIGCSVPTDSVRNSHCIVERENGADRLLINNGDGIFRDPIDTPRSILSVSVEHDLVEHCKFVDCFEFEEDDSCDETFVDSLDNLRASEFYISEDVCADLAHFEEQFYDCYDESPNPEFIRGHTFYDATTGTPPSYPWSTVPKSHRVWEFLKLPMFCIVDVFWNAMHYFLLGPIPQVSRLSRRSKTKRTLFFAPATWLVMTGAIMMLPAATIGGATAGPTFPMSNSISDARATIVAAYQRVERIDEMVYLTPGSLIQFHRIKLKHVIEEIDRVAKEEEVKAQKLGKKRQAIGGTAYQPLSDKELRQYFDSSEEEEILTGMFFMDCCDSEDENIPLESADVFDFASLSRIKYVFDCVHESATSMLAKAVGDPEAYATPSRKALDRLTYLESLTDDPQALLGVGPPLQRPVIFDTGASLSITMDRSDFCGDITPTATDLYLGGLGSNMKIEGMGPVRWTFLNTDGSEVSIRMQCYYVPSARKRLLSPQKLFNKARGITGRYEGTEDCFTLHLNDAPPLRIEYDERSSLPTANALVKPAHAPQLHHPLANLAVVNDENQNLTAGQKLLLLWHSKFGHLHLAAVQRILRAVPFSSARYQSASRCEMPKCSVCEFAKAHRRARHATLSTPNPKREGALKAEDLSPGAQVSVDHFESRLLGRTYDSFGKPSSDQFKGGCIFVDHASGYIHVTHQLGFSAVETIRAKQDFEKMAMDHGVTIRSYLTDNGAFKAQQFVAHIREHEQRIHYCGTNAHHQNGVAERSIRSISNMARAMILHASIHWKSGIDSSLWPMAVHYAAHIYNHMPNEKGLCPSDLFTGSTVPRHHLQDYHVWGCPVYVLDPKLQEGQKLPRWQPRSRRGIFLGLSAVHSSEVPLVLNLQTGSITPQYHVVFDDLFTTVSSIAREEEPPSHWEDLCLEQSVYIPQDATATSYLNDDWLTPEEREIKRRESHRENRVRDTFTPSTDTEPPSPTVSVPSVMHEPHVLPAPLPPIEENVPPVLSPSEGASIPTLLPSEGVLGSPEGGLRRSGRSTRGRFSSTRYVDEVFLSRLLSPGSDPEGHDMQLAYLAEGCVDFDTGEIDIQDPRAYAAKTRQRTDADTPSFREATQGEHAEHYIAAMKLEVATLIRQKTWLSVPRTPDINVLKGTWAFKLKRLPDGTPYRYKARFCVRGDMQQQGVDFFETYAPVVAWSTIRLLLTTVLAEGWTTRQVDYTNAFAQADLKESVHVEPPKLFQPKSGSDIVLKLLKSLYGLRQAPKTFFEKLRSGLIERGWTQSDIDPCLFLKKGIMCVCYVDDTIFAGADGQVLEEEIKSLGVRDDEHRHQFELRNEGEVGAFLGIQIAKIGPSTFYLTQSGLTEKVLKAAGMENANGVDTPATQSSLGADLNGEPFDETWEYRSIIGMLMYLAANTRPDIAYAVHSCARFSHAPRAVHATAVKRILRYLVRTRDKGLHMSPTDLLKVDCYVDSDFAGLFGAEHDQDPVSVKSRTGYIIKYRGCPLLWVSKLQTMISLSTMESEYQALSQSMRDLIPIREILKEIMITVFEKGKLDVKFHAHSKAFEDTRAGCEALIPQSTVYEDNDACLKFARMPKLTPRTKHIAVQYHWFRSKVESLDIAIEPIDTHSQEADGFTKGLSGDKFAISCKRLMGWSLPTVERESWNTKKNPGSRTSGHGKQD